MHGSPSERERTKTRLRGVFPVAPPSQSDTPKAVGRYEVVEVIGKGAMGVVYKARDPLLDRTVAIKTIYAPAQLGERVRRAFLERFEREAKAAARISHPAIVTIFDVGLTQDNPFLVMEYLPGETLADRLDRERMALGPAVECARELASALGFAHKERIVHRDVKPANVLHAGEDRWKLADFGIARLPDSDLTQIGTFMGTPGYAPPEAIREGRYTVQADVFAWGAVFYELLCGRVPYEGPDTETTNKFVLRAEPVSPKQHEASVPEPLAQVALRALAHDPARRYKNGTEAAAALKEAWERSLASGAVSVAQLGRGPAPAAPARTPAPAAPAKSQAPPAPPAAPAAGGGKASAPTALARRAVPAAEPDPATVVDPLPPEHHDDADGVPTAEYQAPAAPAGPSEVRASTRDRADVPLVIHTGPLRIPQPPPSRLWVHVTIAVIALAIGAVLAFYLLRS